MTKIFFSGEQFVRCWTRGKNAVTGTINECRTNPPEQIFFRLSTFVLQILSTRGGNGCLSTRYEQFGYRNGK